MLLRRLIAKVQCILAVAVVDAHHLVNPNLPAFSSPPDVVKMGT